MTALRQHVAVQLDLSDRFRTFGTDGVLDSESSTRAAVVAPPRPGRLADLIEYYFEQGWTDGLPVVPPTPESVAAMVDALGGDA